MNPDKWYIGGRLTTSEPCIDIVVKSAHIFAKQNDMKVLSISENWKRNFYSDTVQGKHACVSTMG